MTEKLYYGDAFLRTFTGRVLECREEKGRWAVVLDRTAFYPEGGNLRAGFHRAADRKSVV